MALSSVVLAVWGFLIFVGLTTEVDTQPMLVIPSLLGMAVGLFLSVRVADNNVGPVVVAAVLGVSILNAYVIVQDWAIAHDQLVLAIFASVSGTVAFGVVLTTLVVLLPIWFPDGVAINGWSRWVARVALALVSVAMFGALFSEQVCVSWGSDDSCIRHATNPWGIPGLDGSIGESLYVGIYLLAIPALVSVVLRWRRSSGIERAQLKWFSLAAVLFIIGFLGSISNESFIGTDISDLLLGLALSGVWVSIGFAVAKYRLYDIDKVVSRSLGYILVVGLLGLVYTFGAVWLPAQLIDQQHPVFVAVSTLAVAALFKPLRSRVLGWVDRRFYRSRYDSEAIATRFSTTLMADHDLSQLPRVWTDAVVEALHPSSVGIWVKGS
jgi:hypothetical protein